MHRLYKRRCLGDSNVHLTLVLEFLAELFKAIKRANFDAKDTQNYVQSMIFSSKDFDLDYYTRNSPQRIFLNTKLT